MTSGRSVADWVLLSYRLPREPSTPRIAVWRKLTRLGVARIGDGLVALPADARTREQFEWLAQEIGEHGGDATTWLGRPLDPGQEEHMIDELRAARAAEYRRIADQARVAPPEDQVRVLRRLREELRRIGQRDFFPPPERDAAEAALRALTGVEVR